MLQNRKYILQVLFLISTTNSYSQFGSPITIDSNFATIIKNVITFDVNNDGLMDIAISESTNNIKWYENMNNTFSTPQDITTSLKRPYHLDIADANGDGFIDLLVTNNNGSNSGASLFFNTNGGESWAEVVIDSNLAIGSFKSFFIDVENDGDKDIIINSDTKITLYKNDGNGNFSSAIIIENMNEYYSMTVGDFTNNGFTDFIVNTATSGMVIFSNTTFGSFNPPIIIDNGLRIFLTSCDIDNDNNIDVASGNPNNMNGIQFYKSNGDGTFSFNHTEQDSEATDVTNSKSCFSDLNNNNFKDFVYIDNNEIFWKENDQSFGFTNTASIENTLNYNIVFSDDIDNDGDNDIIWSGFNPENNTINLGYIKNKTILSINELNNNILPYPNPTGSVIYISNEKNYKEVCLYNGMGQKIMYVKSNKIDLSGLKKGVYYLILTLKNNKRESVKILKTTP